MVPGRHAKAHHTCVAVLAYTGRTRVEAWGAAYSDVLLSEETGPLKSGERQATVKSSDKVLGARKSTEATSRGRQEMIVFSLAAR